MRGRRKKLHPFTTPVAQRLALLFGIVYFAQGMWYLPNQTITISLKDAGLSAGQVATFFAITGLHMTHVVIGLIYLGVICQAVMRGKFKAEDVEVAGLYWHFVDLVWMFVFPLVYLMSAKI